MPDKKAWNTCTISRWTAPREEEFRKDIAARYDDPKPDLPQLSSGNAEVLASLSREKCTALFARFARNGTWLCPTLHNSWRHAHNADAAPIDDERARFYPEVFREYWKAKTSDEHRRSPEFVARWQAYYELVRGMIPDAQHAGVGLLAGSDSGANEYSVPTHDSAQYRYLRGQLQRTKKPQQIRGLNQNHNHEMKEIFKGAATRASCGVGPLHDFYVALLAKGMKPEMARLTLARKIAAIALTLWKKEERFDAEQLKPQAA